MKKMSVLAICALLSTSVMAKDIVIGAVLPITGAVAAYGQTAWKGVEFANKMQSKLKNGDNVKVVLVDNKGDKVETNLATTRLINSDKAVGIIGAMITANTLQVISIAEKQKIPVIAPAATGDKLTMRKRYANRVCFTDSFQGEVIANYAAKTLKYKTAAIITDQAQVYSLGLSKTFSKVFTKNGGKIVLNAKISSGDKDFKAVIAQIKDKNPDMIFVPTYHPEASLIARQTREAGIKSALFSGDGVSNETFIKLGGSAVEGYMFTDMFDPSAPPTNFSKKFLQEYKKSHGDEMIAAFTAMGADAYFLMLDAMNRCKNPSDSVCVNEQIKATKNFEGVSGFITMTKEGNAQRSAVIKEVKDKAFVYKATVNP